MSQSMREAFPALSRPGFHYLDNAAMAQLPGLVSEAVASFNRVARSNVRRGLHESAQRADAAYDGAREAVGRFLNAPAEEVVFTGGCTLALNLAAWGLGRTLGPGDEVVVSRLEHHSACLPWMALAKERGFTLRWLPVTPEGRLDLGDPGAVISSRCKVVAVTHASNVTGAISDLPRLAEAAHAVGARLVVDGAQMVPHGRVDPRALGADLYAFAGHKAYGPTGVGVLWGRAEVLDGMAPLVMGGGMVGAVDDDGFTWGEVPHRFEAGTPPVAQAVGLAAALDWMSGLDWQAVHQQESALTWHLLDGLRAMEGVRIVGPLGLEARVPVVSFTVDGCHPHDLAHLLAERGVAVRGGAHCARPLMSVLGLEEGTVRASLAPYSDRSDVEALLQGLAEAVKVLR
ncbi:aminotransferase class V-fold PLP-dependent enzyme [Paramagnetospirillum magneticum]|uniref:cysteine desulfurase n=1 Tax=Paramagnetospirillum magneticum (strain ATCC 700264 / AMB-1) TaxID=342108 RepID=Q2W392_PARM1|nr:aminotransferase class V-fold PLP-dependent enzyme [Paramagnetospirillum magneticum]BAE51683.1 Selenocysteine lyase [Paramagnetospirillum magneticum AMB-1]